MKYEGGLKVINSEKEFEIDKPIITIVTVVYNGEKEIEDTMRNIIGQTYKNIEYIVIDGNSNDKTLDIIKKYDDNIDYWLSEKDDGIYNAMNKAIDLCTGDWINFMNAGDTFADLNTLEELVKVLDESNDVIYGDRYYIKRLSKKLQKAKPVDTIFERMPFGHQSTFVKKDVLKKFKFNETYKFAADYNLLLTLYTSGFKFQYVEFPICNFLSGGESESGIRPYLEVIKILLDNTKDPLIIQKNAYLQAFRTNAHTLIDQYLEIK